METIPKSECVKIGFFRKTHGVHGAVVLEYQFEFEYSVEDADRIFVELEGLLVPFFIREEGLRFKGANSAIIEFENVEGEGYAKRLIGNGAYLFREEIIDDEEEAGDSRFENYLLIEKTAGEIGRIDRVDNFSGNRVFTVIFRDRELMIPYNEELVVEIDETQKMLTMELPEGLIG